VTHNLNFEFAGGDTTLTFPLKIGERIVAAGLETYLWWSAPVPHELLSALPQRILVKPDKSGFIPDFGYASGLGFVFVVSGRFVDLMNSIDPASQQFLKIPEAVTNKGEPLNRDFYLMNVLLRLDAVDIEHSTVEWKKTEHGTRLLAFRPGPLKDRKLVLQRSIVDAHHLWRGGPQHFASYFFCSDHLRDAMARAGLSQLWFEHVAAN
jgi:hypothetical protein